jgi:hypothetical protein
VIELGKGITEFEQKNTSVSWEHSTKRLDQFDSKVESSKDSVSEEIRRKHQNADSC